MTTTIVTIEIVVKGAGALDVVNSALDAGAIQEAIEAFSAGTDTPVRITMTTCHARKACAKCDAPITSPSLTLDEPERCHACSDYSEAR